MAGVLTGRIVVLRQATPAHVPPLVRIRATPEVHRRWRGDDLEDDVLRSILDEEVQVFAIEAGSTIVGAIQWAEEDDPDYRHANVDIYVDPAMHRRGYAQDAINTLVQHLFDACDHHRITIDPAADNAAAIACYAAVGFREVGVMRQYERGATGAWHDGLLMELLRNDG